MQKRDFAILLVSCIAMLVSLQNEGTFSFRKAWYYTPSADGETLVDEPHRLPPPIVADLNGDGHLEVILATQDLKIQVVMPVPASHQGGGFAPAHPVAQVSLLYKRVLVTAGRRPVAMAVGYLDPMPVERVRAPRRQVLVVLTASWQVICFDHNLKLMWEQDIRVKFPHHARIKEVALSVGPHQVRVGDRGLVVVGASLQTGDLASGEGLESVEKGPGGAAGSFADDDILMEELRVEEEMKTHAKSADAKEELQDIEGGAVAAVTRHFTYYALEGGRGEERWHHASEDFHHDLTNLAGELQPQNNYKLEAERVEARHYGEASCRDYRESMLHVLPHSWTQPQDTWLQEAHFIKHKEARGAQKSSLAHQGKARAKGHVKSNRVVSPPGPKQGMMGSLFGGVSSMLGARHSRHHGTPAAHPASGHTAHATTRHHNRHNHHAEHHSNLTANALVAHLSEGIEVIHLFTGRTICQLHLSPGALHADVNGDGVVDHVQVYHGATAEGEDTDMDDNAHHPGSHCLASVTSGIPPRERLFQINVCRTNRFMSGAKGASLASILEDEDSEHEATELATPVLLPLPQLGHGYASHRTQHGLIIFVTNKGQISAVNAKGQHVWQNYFPSTWPHTASQEGTVKVVPTVAAIALHRHAVPTTVLVAGEEVAVLVSEHGHLLDTLWLPGPPVQPLLVVDFNGDGHNDIILVSTAGIFGYSQVQHYGGFTLSALLACLIIAMGIVYYTQQYGVAGGEGRPRTGRKLRSTEYMD